ncbi:MAG: ligase-associated DNA damage response DEXH box helicase [Saprospiraceae bacterium]|nr:ligase-associated DNA damage response DEXH box helicase [Saprospiraceae bacterium]
MAEAWFVSNQWRVFPFQRETWTAYLNGRSGLVNAPTGSGKTYSLAIPAILEGLHKNENAGLQLIWITPIRALTKEIHLAVERAITALGSPWKAEIRSGDTATGQRKKQWENPPQILITTPESIHVMLATKGYHAFFKNIKAVVVDEWHELMGSKRGVQTELLLARLRTINPALKVWGISATIGNMDEAIDVLHGSNAEKSVRIRADIQKKIRVETLIPEAVEKFPWAGHLGIRMLQQVLPIIYRHRSTLIFTNTRAQCEIWYQQLLVADPELAGQIAMHHGSISRELREWVEDALYEGRLKAVVCTSSLDLGVDFRPVEAIVQIGSPKGVARFIQRAGRSGHQPGAESAIYFVPTHSLELVEAAALRTSIENQELEERIPYVRSFDVLIQYLMTLAVSEGFKPDQVYEEISTTFSYRDISRDEWLQILNFLLYGGKSLAAYDEYQKITISEGFYRVEDRWIAQRHRLSIGTIISDAMLQVQYVRGKRLGVIEEWFIAQLAPGDSFWFAGRALELVRIKDMTVQVRDTKKHNSRIPSYMGGRLPLSSQMSEVLRFKMNEYLEGKNKDVEITALVPLFQMQQSRSMLPGKDDFLVEYFESEEGFHLVFYPFEGRNVHEGLAALIAKRLSRKVAITFSLAMNDYGFELLSDKKLDVAALVNKSLFATHDLIEDIQASLNAVEMARRRFRDIAMISGLIFQGFPGKQKKERHLQSSAQLLFNVFHEYESDNLLYLQTYEEVRTFQLEEARMRRALERIQSQQMSIQILEKPSPFCFPLIVDRLREKLSSEKLEDRIRRMTMDLG